MASDVTRPRLPGVPFYPDRSQAAIDEIAGVLAGALD